MQKALIVIILAISGWLLFLVGRYWWADYLYAQGRYVDAVKLVPHEPMYRVALGTPEEVEKAVAMAPRNIKLLEIAANAYVDMGENIKAIEVQEGLTGLAPTYAKVYFVLGVNYLQVGNTAKGVENLEKALALKPNYEKAERLLGILDE